MLQYEQNDFDGEDQITRALSGTGVSKLVLDVAKEADAHIAKAEDLLWPENQKKVPWKDLRSKALQNPRWTWLPHNGLEALRKIAEERGIWRDNEDGYLERGPFAKPKTAVSITEVTEQDPATGRVTLNIGALGAGKAPQIYCDKSPAVGTKGQRLTDPKLETSETRLYFIAVDPKGEHGTGEAVCWTNKLTLTHQPTESGGTRHVELKVVPRGTIRYTLTGANPAEGEIYKKSIAIGDGAQTIYCHAEDDGVTARRNFEIPPRGTKGAVIKKEKPATLTERVETADTTETFTLIKQLKEAKAQAGTLKLEVGQGTKSLSLRFGTECRVTGEKLEALIAAARSALDDGAAEVRVAVTGSIYFGFGADLESFAGARGIELDPENVSQ